MIIFYPQTDYMLVTPVVVFDALDSSDRFTSSQITAAVYKNTPDSVEIAPYKAFSCTYDFEFSHDGIPLGQGMKTHISARISSPPAELVSQLSPRFFVSAMSMEEMADVFSSIANPQTTIVYAALVIKTESGDTISRKFIAYSANIAPDLFGTTTTLVINGAALSDVLIKSDAAVIIDKLKPLDAQLIALLAAAGYIAVFMTEPAAFPVADRLFPPLKLRAILDEICLQNKLAYSIDEGGKVVSFYSQNESPALSLLSTAFSFLGSVGSIAWAPGVENFANIRFKTSYFDAQLYQKITMYNDINAGFFSGLASNGVSALYDAYDAYIIRYKFIRSADEIITEVTATNNWLLAQMRVDGILESSVYGATL